MARRRPEEPHRTIHIPEKEMTWRQIHEEHGGVVPRGVLVRPGRPKAKALEHMHTIIGPSRVYVPWWPMMPDGRLRETPDMRAMPDLPTAIRHETHKLTSVRGTNRRTWHIRSSVELIHARVVDDWDRMSAGERDETWRHIQQIHAAIRGRRKIADTDDRNRRMAAERLEGLLERREQEGVAVGPDEIADTLREVAHDLTARRNVLRPQMRYIGRLRRALIERKTELDETAFQLLDQVTAHRARVRRGVPRRGPEKRELMVQLRRLRSALDKRPEPELRDNAARHVQNAIESLTEKKPASAVTHLRKGARAILASNAQYAWLYPSRLEQVAQSGSRRFREMVAERQLRLYRDNLQYWHSKESHEPLKPRDIRELLIRVGQLAPGTDIQRAAEEAAEELRKRRVAGAKQVLTDFLEARGS